MTTVLERLKRDYEYNPETGYFTFKSSRGGKRKGSKANSVMSYCGYIRITVGNVRYLAHRMAWLYVTGKLPVDQLDHINGNRQDNRFVNFREVTDQQNKFNKLKICTNTSGVKNVHWCKKTKTWNVTMMRSKKSMYFGSFSTIEEAKVVAEAVRERLYGEFANHSSLPAWGYDGALARYA